MRYLAFVSSNPTKSVALALSLFLALCLFALCAPEASAQFPGSYNTTMNMQDNLSGGPVGSAAGNVALNRARGMNQPAPSYYEDEEDDYYYDDEEYGDYAPVEVFEYIPTPIVKIYHAMRGRRVYDAVTYKIGGAGEALLLDDYRSLMITEEQKKNYSDAGQQGDWEAGDEVYSDMKDVSTSDYMGGTTFYNLTRNVALLDAAQKVNPLDFFGLTVLTTERFSRVESLRERIQQQNDKIYKIDEDGNFSGWSERFLKNYRTESFDPDSGFYPLYVPEPPEAPATPRPVLTWWRPPNSTDTPWDLTVDNILDAQLLVDLDKRAAGRALVEAQAEKEPEYKDQMFAEYGPPSNIMAAYKAVHPEMFPEDMVINDTGYGDYGDDEGYYEDE